MKVFSAALLLAATSAISLNKGDGKGDKKPPTCADRIFEQVWGMMDLNGDAELTQKEFDTCVAYAAD